MLQRVLKILPEFEGQFTSADIVEKLGVKLGGGPVFTAVASWAKKGVIKRVGRESKAPRRTIYVYVEPEE